MNRDPTCLEHHLFKDQALLVCLSHMNVSANAASNMSTASSGPILDDPRKLRIAICGGGLGGVALANALLHHSHLDVHIYESKPEFSVRGAAIGVATNAQKALAAFVPSVSELLSRAGAVQMNSMRLLVVFTGLLNITRESC